MKSPLVLNQAGKTLIDAVPPLGWGKGKECTFAGALEAAFAVTTTPFSYEDLMGWAGLAFRVRWFLGQGGEESPHWSASSPTGELANELAALRHATGYALNAVPDHGETEPTMERFAGNIVGEINAGRPVLAHDPTLNMGVIYGFENEGQIVLLRSYMSDEPTLRLPVGQLGPLLCFLGDRGPALSPRDALLEGIRLGVATWHHGFTPGTDGRFWLGHAALLKWREDVERAGDLCFDEKRLLFFVNWWVFDCLTDARINAERFLRRHAALLSGSPHRHLTAAADAYGIEARMLRTALADKHMFLGPWTGKELQHWSSAVREREVAFLGRLLAAEADAMGELENLLDASDIPLPHRDAVAAR
jgi:hypothetical protein